MPDDKFEQECRALCKEMESRSPSGKSDDDSMPIVDAGLEQDLLKELQDIASEHCHLENVVRQRGNGDGRDTQG